MLQTKNQNNENVTTREYKWEEGKRGKNSKGTQVHSLVTG